MLFLSAWRAPFATSGLNPTPTGLTPLTHSLAVSCSLCLREEEVGCQKTTTDPSSPPSRTFRSSFSTRFRTSGNALLNLVNEAESAGEHLSDGDLKAIIFAKMPADTAASLRQEQSNEKVKSLWTEVTGFPKSMGRFQVRDALKKCSPCNFFKSKEKDGVWRLNFAEKADRVVFTEVVDRGVSFKGTRL